MSSLLQGGLAGRGRDSIWNLSCDGRIGIASVSIALATPRQPYGEAKFRSLSLNGWPLPTMLVAMFAKSFPLSWL